MAWQQVRFEFDGAELATVESVLEALGAEAITLEDAEDHPLYEPLPGETPVWPRVTLSALFAEDADTQALRDAIAAVEGLSLLRWESERVGDRDWVRAWMDQFAPMRFGERLWICPSWQTPPVADAVNLMLDPGLAFGSGTHPTTALCLEWLDAHPPECRDVIDYGCGSGILALAALKLGARFVAAVDIDPQALTATRDNVERNGDYSGNYLLCRPDGLPPDAVDVLLANILANPLIELAPRLASHVRSGGWAVLSGILEAQADAVADAYRPWFDIAARSVKHGWVRLDCQRH